MLRLAVVTLVVTFSSLSGSAQDCGCDSFPSSYSNQGCVPRCGLRAGFGMGCGFGLGCGFGNSGSNDRCLTADQLWEGFETSTDCQGCVKRNPFKLRGLGGFPAARICPCNEQQECCNPSVPATSSTLRIPVPSLSVNWPKPVQVIQPVGNCQTALANGFSSLRIGKQKDVRCDIPNDCFGKLGESRSAVAKRPSAIHGRSVQPVSTYSSQAKLAAPPVPVVESLESLTELPTIEKAQNTDYLRNSTSR